MAERFDRYPDSLVDRRVNVKRGQTVRIIAGPKIELDVIRFESGAVHLVNPETGSVLRSWSPRESGTRRRRRRSGDGCKPLEELLRF